MLSKNSVIGMIGSGAMGSGIGQVAATARHHVFVYDNNQVALQKAGTHILSATNSKKTINKKVIIHN